jgi:hypothetical protein
MAWELRIHYVESVLSNIGVFYYTIKNLHPRFNSCCANVHLVSKIVAEINKLSRNGLEIDISGRGLVKIYAGLCQVTCDSLALNGIFGFTECFSASYFCTLCYTSKDDIQTKFREEDFALRT